MDPIWFNYCLSIWPEKPDPNVVPQYVLDNMQRDLDDFVARQNVIDALKPKEFNQE